MRKLLPALVAVWLCCPSVFAQHKKEKASFGFKAGVNISSFRTAIDYSDFEPTPKLGQVFGAFVQIPLSSRFILQPEFLYSQMGSMAKSTLWGDVTFRYNYFSIPVLLKYKIGKIFSASAGFEANNLVRARQKQTTKTTTITNDIKDFDFAYTAGIATAGKTWTFDIRYIHGSQDVSPAPATTTFFNQAVQLTVGYKLAKKAAKTK
ncbi:MAG: porin family protein [Bacteroidota bacterium]